LNSAAVIQLSSAMSGHFSPVCHQTGTAWLRSYQVGSDTARIRNWQTTPVNRWHVGWKRFSSSHVHISLPHIARAVHQHFHLRRLPLPRDRFHFAEALWWAWTPGFEEIEANSRLWQEAAAEQAGRRKKEAEAEKASEQILQQDKETAREKFAGFLAGAAKGENQ